MSSLRFQMSKSITKYLDITKQRCKSIKSAVQSKLSKRPLSSRRSTAGAADPAQGSDSPAPASNEMKPYIVIYKQGAPDSEIDAEIERVQKAGGKLKQRYDSPIMKGFAATMPENFAQALTTKSAAGGDAHM